MEKFEKIFQVRIFTILSAIVHKKQAATFKKCNDMIIYHNYNFSRIESEAKTMKTNKIVMFCAVLAAVVVAWAAFGIASAREMTPEQRAAVDRLRGSNVSDGSSVLGTATEQLLRAVKSEYVSAKRIEKLIEAGADVNTKDKDGHTALILLCYEMCTSEHLEHDKALLEAMKVLIKYGADVNIRYSYGTALTTIGYRMLIGYNSKYAAEAVKLLIKAGADVNAKDENGYTALMHVFHSEAVRALLKAGADVNAKSNGGSTALIVASDFDAPVETINLLIKAGSNVNAKDINGVTALMAAARSFSTSSNALKADVVKALMKAGANIHIKDAEGKTALIYAAYSENLGTGNKGLTLNPEIITLLTRAGANVNVQDKEGKTALMYAVAPVWFEEDKSSLKAVNTLIKAKANINLRDKDGKTALMYAAAANYADLEVVKLLIKSGADVNIKDKEGKTALDYVQDYDDETYNEVRKILQDAMKKQ